MLYYFTNGELTGEKQKEYSVEYKREAVRLMETSGKSAVQIARELGVSDSVLCHWCKILAEKGEQAFPGKGHQTESEEELRRLRQEMVCSQVW
jgi:transposase